MKQVLIMRGIPGAGKSTFVKTWFKTAAVCSADHFFTDPVTGEYKFDKYMLPSAHVACKAKFKAMLEAGHPLVVVDNTNICKWEYAWYVTEAEKLNYSVAFITMECSVHTAFGRCIHNVPLEAIQKKFDRLNS